MTNTSSAPRLNNAHDVYLQSLRDLVAAEQAFQPLEEQLSGVVDSLHLLRCLNEQHHLSTLHQERLQSIFEKLDQPLEASAGCVVRGLVKRVGACLALDPSSRHDILVVALVRNIRHHKISLYGTALAHAKRYRHHDAARLLEASLQDEQQIDRELIQLGEFQIYMQEKPVATPTVFFRARDLKKIALHREAHAVHA